MNVSIYIIDIVTILYIIFTSDLFTGYAVESDVAAGAGGGGAGVGVQGSIRVGFGVFPFD